MPYRNAPETINVLGKTFISEATMIVTDTAAAHAAADFCGEDAVPMTFANCAAENGGSGKVIGCTFIDGDKQSIAGELWLFDRAPTGLPADNAPFSISDADAKYLIGVIPFATYYASALNSVSVGAPSSPIVFKCAGNSKSLFGAFVTRAAPTYVTLIPFFRLFVTQD